MIGIVAARPEELAVLLESAEPARGAVSEETVAGRTLLYRTIQGKDVVFAVSGMGKVAAGATAAVLAERVSGVILAGTAGGLGIGILPGDVMVADRVRQHDLDLRPICPRWTVEAQGANSWPCDPGYIAALEAGVQAALGAGGSAAMCHTGLLISGDWFVSSPEDGDHLRTLIPDVVGIEVGGASAAQVYYEAGVPCGIVRTIADRADADAKEDYIRHLETNAGELLASIITTALMWV
ncbi:MAG: 5'-methylthioadenosine/adenosylhomocysteine nucleosidase [Cellulomonadaceae bacterium]|jgi:adenosylhomocysteine nucleosidase|nr:5'-methylthioadenosine/adenosylhomocysteine nucleosidase [Cellulomonadaceae bacterium]